MADSRRPARDGQPLPFDGDPPRLLFASLSGESDAAWARAGTDVADCAILGGIALDDASRAAARELVARDRNEFLPDDPVAFVASQLDALADASIRAGVNVRTTTRDPLVRVARRCAAHEAILEVNAHCRQPELCAVGCGETLLRDTDRLASYVAAAAETDATVSVKVRAGVDGVDLPGVARRVDRAGASMLHVDAMDAEPVVADVVAAAPSLFVVANNEVRDRDSVREYLGLGADAVSVGRPSRRPDGPTLRRVRAAVDEWFAGGDADTADATPVDGGDADTPR